MRRCDNIVARIIHDSYFLINTKQSYHNDKCHLYETNEIGYYIWNEIDGTQSSNEIAENLYSIIVEEIEYCDILSDVNEFLQLLIEQGFVEV